MYGSPSPKRLRHHLRKGSRNTLRARGWEDRNKTVSKHGRTTAPRNSQQVWLPADNLDKIKPVNTPAWSRKGLTGFHPEMKRDGQLMASETWRDSFL